MKIKSSEICQECKTRETIEHFFYFCTRRTKLWKHVEKLIFLYLSRRVQIKWTDAIFGIETLDGFCKREILIINIIIMLAKFSVSKSVYGSQQDPCIILENEISIRKII